LNIFSKFSNSQKTPHKIEIPSKKQLSEELVKEPVTLGDHLRRRRLKLGLYQKDVAIQIGVTASTIWNWENGWSSIALGCMSKAIAFLGHNPISCPEDLIVSLACYKQVNGLPLEELGAEMSRDPEQLPDWLSGRHQPNRKNREAIEIFLSKTLKER